MKTTTLDEYAMCDDISFAYICLFTFKATIFLDGVQYRPVLHVAKDVLANQIARFFRIALGTRKRVNNKSYKIMYHKTENH